MSKDAGVWPKETLYCPECVILGFGHRTDCKGLNEPKQQVSVLPTSVAADLALRAGIEARERICEELAEEFERRAEGASAEATEFPHPVEEALLATAAFCRYHAALGEEAATATSERSQP
jgi:hypothetical protein